MTARYPRVGTDEGHRRRGLASYLLGVAARWAADPGCGRWVIVTEATNPAGRVYRSLGRVRARQRQRPGVPQAPALSHPRLRHSPSWHPEHQRGALGPLAADDNVAGAHSPPLGTSHQAHRRSGQEFLRLSISCFSSIILSSRPTVNRWNRSSSASRCRSHACRSAISF
jgi:hypothetical protein